MRLAPAAAAVLAAASLFPAATLAQEVDEGLELKPALGLTFSGVSKDPATGTTTAQPGWQLGGTVLFGERLYLEGGAFYATKSTDITAATASGSIDFKGVSGFRIPVMVGYHLVGREHGSFAVRGFGGAAAFLVTSVDAQGLSKSDFESPTYGVFLGAGVDFLFLFADLKYEWSLTDLGKTFDVGQSRSLYLNVGMKLLL